MSLEREVAAFLAGLDNGPRPVIASTATLVGRFLEQREAGKPGSKGSVKEYVRRYLRSSPGGQIIHVVTY